MWLYYAAELLLCPPSCAGFHPTHIFYRIGVKNEVKEKVKIKLRLAFEPKLKVNIEYSGFALPSYTYFSIRWSVPCR